MDSDSSNDGSDGSDTNVFYDRPGPDWEYVTQVAGGMYEQAAQKEVISCCQTNFLILVLSCFLL